MPMAARLPAPSASATVRAASVTSPPAKSVARLDWPSESTQTPEAARMTSPGRSSRSDASPIAVSTVSAGSVTRSPVETGRRRPLGAGPPPPPRRLGQGPPGAQPQRRTPAVHRRVAATHDDDVAADVRAAAVVDLPKESETGPHALDVLAGDTERVAHVRS